MRLSFCPAGCLSALLGGFIAGSQLAPAASVLGVLPTLRDVIASVRVTVLSLYSPLEVGVSGLSFGFPVHVEWIFVGGVR